MFATHKITFIDTYISVFAWVEVVVAVVAESEFVDSLKQRHPVIGKRYLSESWVCFYICLLLFVIGVWFTAYSGLYWLNLCDHFIPQFSLMAIGMLEPISVAWTYGFENFKDRVKSTTQQVSSLRKYEVSDTRCYLYGGWSNGHLWCLCSWR